LNKQVKTAVRKAKTDMLLDEVKKSGRTVLQK